MRAIGKGEEADRTRGNLEERLAPRDSAGQHPPCPHRTLTAPHPPLTAPSPHHTLPPPLTTDPSLPAGPHARRVGAIRTAAALRTLRRPISLSRGSTLPPRLPLSPGAAALGATTRPRGAGPGGGRRRRSARRPRALQRARCTDAPRAPRGFPVGRPFPRPSLIRPSPPCLQAPTPTRSSRSSCTSRCSCCCTRRSRASPSPRCSTGRRRASCGLPSPCLPPTLA